jgi:hypothetical protein
MRARIVSADTTSDIRERAGDDERSHNCAEKGLHGRGRGVTTRRGRLRRWPVANQRMQARPFEPLTETAISDALTARGASHDRREATELHSRQWSRFATQN